MLRKVLLAVTAMMICSHAGAEPLFTDRRVPSSDDDLDSYQVPTPSGYEPPVPTTGKHHVGATFSKPPTVVMDQLAQLCTERGFAVKRVSDNDVICRAGSTVIGIPGKNARFHALLPAGNVRAMPQVFIRFLAVPTESGSSVTAYGTTTSPASHILTGHKGYTAVSLMGWAANSQLKELYTTLGGVPK